MALEEIVSVTDSNFEQEVLEADRPALVDFWASWCAPCETLARVLEELAPVYNRRVKITKLNVEESPQTCARYGVRSIPTLILFKEGKVVGQEIGTVPRRKVENLITKALGLNP